MGDFIDGSRLVAGFAVEGVTAPADGNEKDLHECNDSDPRVMMNVRARVTSCASILAQHTPPVRRNLVDNLTHTLFALTLANAGLRRASAGATAALVVAANVPDFEFVATISGGRVAYLQAHRGPTHGPAGLLLAALTAAAVWAAYRRFGTGERPRFRPLLAVASVGVLGHIAMDFATSYGTRVLSPFTEVWFGVDWMPIVDVFLLLIMAAGLIIGRIVAVHAGPDGADRLRRRIAAAVLLLLAADYAARGALHASAVASAVELQQALQGGQRPEDGPPTVFRYLGLGRPAALPAALPSEISPFRWRLVVADRSGYLVTEVNLRRRGPGWQDAAKAAGVWFPNDTGPLVDRAAAATMGRVFLNFSRFPAAEIVTHRNGDLTIHWYDLRFAQHRRPVGNDRRRHTSPFAAWVRVTPGGTVVAQGLGPG